MTQSEKISPVICWMSLLLLPLYWICTYSLVWSVMYWQPELASDHYMVTVWWYYSLYWCLYSGSVQLFLIVKCVYTYPWPCLFYVPLVFSFFVLIMLDILESGEVCDHETQNSLLQAFCVTTFMQHGGVLLYEGWWGFCTRAALQSHLSPMTVRRLLVHLEGWHTLRKNDCTNGRAAMEDCISMQLLLQFVSNCSSCKHSSKCLFPPSKWQYSRVKKKDASTLIHWNIHNSSAADS